MKRTMMAGLIAGMLTLAACGGSSGSGGSALSGDDAKAASSISDAIVKSQKAGDSSSLLDVDKKDADCIGKGFVDKVGTDDLKKYGLLTKDLKTNKDLGTVKMSKGDAEGAADVLTGCTDLTSMMKKAMASSMGSLDAKTKACVDKALNEDALHDVFVAVFSGDSTQAGQQLQKPLMKCAQQAQQ